MYDALRIHTATWTLMLLNNLFTLINANRWAEAKDYAIMVRGMMVTLKFELEADKADDKYDRAVESIFSHLSFFGQAITEEISEGMTSGNVPLTVAMKSKRYADIVAIFLPLHDEKFTLQYGTDGKFYSIDAD